MRWIFRRACNILYRHITSSVIFSWSLSNRKLILSSLGYGNTSLSLQVWGDIWKFNSQGHQLQIYPSWVLRPHSLPIKALNLAKETCQIFIQCPLYLYTSFKVKCSVWIFNTIWHLAAGDEDLFKGKSLKCPELSACPELLRRLIWASHSLRFPNQSFKVMLSYMHEFPLPKDPVWGYWNAPSPSAPFSPVTPA